MENENMNNEVIEMAEEFGKSGIKTGLMIGLGVGVGGALGVVAYKKFIKPAVKKFKDKRAAKNESAEADEQPVDMEDESKFN